MRLVLGVVVLAMAVSIVGGRPGVSTVGGERRGGRAATGRVCRELMVRVGRWWWRWFHVDTSGFSVSPRSPRESSEVGGISCEEWIRCFTRSLRSSRQTVDVEVGWLQSTNDRMAARCDRSMMSSIMLVIARSTTAKGYRSKIRFP